MTHGATAAEERPITPAEALRYAQAMCTAAGSETPRLDGEVLLRHVLGIDRTALYARMNETMSAAQAATFLTLLGRRVAGEPVAYLTGYKEFMGMGFAVGAGVLVPRPETELLVEWALGWLAEHPGSTLVDVGTGPGTIALSVAALTPLAAGISVIGVDVSAEALRWAAGNRRGLGLDDRVVLREGDLLSGMDDASVDLVLANLPYLTPQQVQENPWLAMEPELALLGGEDGMALVRRLIADLPRVLRRGGAVGLEVDPSQVAETSHVLSGALPGAVVTVIRDLAGFERHVTATTQ